MQLQLVKASEIRMSRPIPLSESLPERRFDIIGNLPEDILGGVIAHLEEIEDLLRLISWQTVSRRWRILLHNSSTRIYHQTLLCNSVFRNLLPPSFYGTGKDGESPFSYATFRRAIKTHMAILSGSLSPVPRQYKFERFGGKVEAGPILADGFLVWLATTRLYPGHTITLKYINLTTPGFEPEEDVGVAEFTCGNDYKIHRNGYDIEWIDLHTLNNMTWRALGCGGGLVAYWIAGDPHVTIRELTTTTTTTLPISGLSPATSKTQDRYINHLLCNKDYLVVSLSRSSFYGVYSIRTKALLHILDVSKEVPDIVYNVFTGLLSGWRDRTSFALKIQDNYLIVTCVLGMYFVYEDPHLRFLSWDLTSAPLHEATPSPPGPEIYTYDAFLPTPPPKDRPHTPLPPLAELTLPIALTTTQGLYGPKLLFQADNHLQLYCSDAHSPTHPTHPHLRFSYSIPPTALVLTEGEYCKDHPPLRRGYRRVYKEEGKVFERFRRRYATDARFGLINYELVLPAVPVWSGGVSVKWRDQVAWGEAKKCVRLQMVRAGVPGKGRWEKGGKGEVGEVLRVWDADVEMRRWRQYPHMGHGVCVCVGWEGVVVLWLDRVLVWRWDLEEGGKGKGKGKGKEGKDEGTEGKEGKQVKEGGGIFGRMMGKAETL